MEERVKEGQGFLAEDKSLMEKVTVFEFQTKKAAPGNTDKHINDAFEAYCNVLEKN